LRVVLDTNILVSAFVFPGGPPERLLGLCLESRIQLVSSNDLIRELARVLGERFSWAGDRVEGVVSLVLGVSHLVTPSRSPAKRLAVVAADPDDDRVLEAALDGAAEVVVSGDHHLLDLEVWEGIRIVRAAPFLAELQA